MHRATPPEIFDRRRRHAMRTRADHRLQSGHFIWESLAEEMSDRLRCTTRRFERALIIGPLAYASDYVVGEKAVAADTLPFADEDRLGLEPSSYDLILSAGTLDSVNDLPGALVQIRRSLRPDGLFLGAMFGAGSLASLKKAMLTADGARAKTHVHPQVELRSAADLLSRAGFALPVADKATIEVRYQDWRKLAADLRDAGVGNCLVGPREFLGRNYVKQLDTAWAQARTADGRVTERFEILHLSGWAPSPDQPKPAARGSGTVSLTKIFDKLA